MDKGDKGKLEELKEVREVRKAPLRVGEAPLQLIDFLLWVSVSISASILISHGCILTLGRVGSEEKRREKEKSIEVNSERALLLMALELE